ncbi:MAG: 3-hydroxyacyl-ACP dehydratase FabZ [Bacillota bacterium]
MNILEINERIKQRPPFQMLDRVIDIRPGEYAKGIKNVSINEPYFIGHFPDLPIMPGVLITESAAQLCALVMSYGNFPEGKVPVLLKVEQMKFIKAVIPGDVLVVEVKNIQKSISISKFEATVTVADKKAATGTLAFTFADKDTIYSS